MGADTVTTISDNTRASAGHHRIRSVSAWPPFTTLSTDATELTTAIRNAIAPWRYRVDQRPPFSPTELVVMALAVCHEPMKRKDLFFWVYDTFDYYRDTEGPNALWTALCGRDSRDSRCFPWFEALGSIRKIKRGPDFYNILRSYASPVKSNGGDHGLEYQVKLSVDLKEAKNFLQPRLWPCQRPGHFPFLHLPAEIRTTIYEMVFRYPSAGVNIPERNLKDERVVYTYSRDLGAQLYSGLWQHHNPYAPPGYKDVRWTNTNDQSRLLEIGKLCDVLAITQVSRQLWREASGVFFAINTFCFDSALHLWYVLERIPAKHRDSIERIAFAYRCDTVAYVSMREVFATMAAMKSLRWLHISIIQQEWRDAQWHGDPAIEDRLQFNRAVKIPSSVEVVLDGDYPDTTERDIRSDPIVDEETINGQHLESCEGQQAAICESHVQSSEVAGGRRRRLMSIKRVMKAFRGEARL